MGWDPGVGMVETDPAAGRLAPGERAAYGFLLAVTGVVAVGIGGVLASNYPALAATLVGLPVGFGAWVAVRRTAAHTVGWPPAAEPTPEPAPAARTATDGGER